jgi:hypothetical protein
MNIKKNRRILSILTANNYISEFIEFIEFENFVTVIATVLSNNIYLYIHK